MFYKVIVIYRCFCKNTKELLILKRESYSSSTIPLRLFIYIPLLLSISVNTTT